MAQVFSLRPLVFMTTTLLSVAAFSQSLSLENAYRMALDSHPSLQQRRALVNAARQDIAGVKWQRYPTISAEGGRELWQNSSNKDDSKSNTTLRIAQPLWTGGRISTAISAAELREQISVLNVSETELEVMLRVTQAYIDAIRLGERIVVARDNLAEHVRLFELIKRRRDQEVTAEVDVDLAEARLQQAKTELMTFEAGQANARATLEQLIGDPRTFELLKPKTTPLNWASVGDAFAAATQASPFLKRLKVETELAQNEVQGRKANLMPQVSLRYERFTGNGSNTANNRLMLALDYQTGAGLSAASAVDAASSRADAARTAYEAGERDLRERILNLHNEARTYSNQWEPAQAFAKSAEAVKNSYLRQYTTGRKSWLEVMNAQRELAQARYASADIAAGLWASSTRLDLLTGRLQAPASSKGN